MKKILYVFVAFLFSLVPADLNGQVIQGVVDESAVAEEDGIVADYEVYGLKKTQKRYVEQQLLPFMGKKKSEVNEKKIELALRVTGLFSKQECAFRKNSDGSFTLVIHVEEKMS